jgi:NAD(P)-dependent dehydrogenase (short-subunit alcohol dehydrogenase family)
MALSLSGRKALVTGAAGGIGSAICRTLVRHGASIAIHYKTKQAQALDLAKELNLDDSAALAADLTDPVQVKDLFDRASGSLRGTVDTLVVNAAIYESKGVSLDQMSLEQWQGTFSNNVTSAFLSIQAFLSAARKASITDPSIVLIGSTAGMIGEAFHADYAASKSALIYGLMMSLKNEIPRWAPRGRINAVCPSWTLTPMASDFVDHPEAVLRHLQTTALRRVARPEEVAESVAFLASPTLAGHITGQILELSGGLEGRMLYSPSEIDLNQA